MLPECINSKLKGFLHWIKKKKKQLYIVYKRHTLNIRTQEG